MSGPMKKLTYERKYLLLGYKDMLDKAPPNGRLIHEVTSKRTGLYLCLKAQADIDATYEMRVKDLIRELYAGY